MHNILSVHFSLYVNKGRITLIYDRFFVIKQKAIVPANAQYKQTNIAMKILYFNTIEDRLRDTQR